MGRSTRKERANRQLLWVAAAIVLAILAATRREPLTAFWLGLYAIAAAGWLILDKLPTKCGMPTTRGTPCKRDTTGVLFGCKDHTWDKFFAWFGWRRREPARRHFSMTPTRTEAEQPVGTVKNGEKRRDGVIFWFTVSASSAAIISMITDLMGLFD